MLLLVMVSLIQLILLENTVITCESYVGDGAFTCDGTTGTAVTYVVDTYYKDTLTRYKNCALKRVLYSQPVIPLKLPH